MSLQISLLPEQPVLGPHLQSQKCPLSTNMSEIRAAQNPASTWGSCETQMRQTVDGKELQKSTQRSLNPRGFLVVVCKARGAVRKFSPPVFTSSSLS
jgi:hypothetical protein